ncbi:MAG: IS1595 family transposase [Candidatus Sulfotelmatobacter sp.]|jgi:transposase-like protein
MNRRQTIPAHLRYTRNQFDADFPTDDVCFETILAQRFPGGVAHCEKCGQDRKHYRVTGRTALACDHCGNHIYPLAGTIFEKTTTPLRIWFQAMYLMGSTRCGISAKQIQRETGVTYKTAWRMFRQIRSLLSEPDMQLEGSTVEMDELYYGGRPRGKRRGPKWLETNKKSVVAGVVERKSGKGRVIARVVEDASKKTLQDFAHEFILPESTVFTDEHPSYTGLDKTYTHHRIQHAAGVYVKGDVHTQTIEGFWSLVQNGIRGVYHSVSKKYLQTYLNEYAFRYNRREMGNRIFPAILARVSEKVSSKPSATVAENHTA